MRSSSKKRKREMSNKEKQKEQEHDVVMKPSSQEEDQHVVDGIEEHVGEKGEELSNEVQKEEEEPGFLFFFSSNWHRWSLTLFHFSSSN
jgi:hypothetical protein